MEQVVNSTVSVEPDKDNSQRGLSQRSRVDAPSDYEKYWALAPGWPDDVVLTKPERVQWVEHDPDLRRIADTLWKRVLEDAEEAI